VKKMVFLTVLLLSVPLVTAQCDDHRPEGGDTVFANFHSDPRGVFWEVTENFDVILMTVQGPQDWCYSETFFNARVPAFDFGTDSFTSCDGLYKYSLIVIPFISDSIQEALLEARDKENLDAISNLLIRAGVPRQAIV